MPDCNCRNCTPPARATTLTLAARRKLMAQAVLTVKVRHGETRG